MTLKNDVPLEDVVGELEEIIPRLLENGGVPGLSVALIRDAECAWTGSYGVKNAETRDPVTPQTVFPAASCSKPVAAYAALKLCEDGVLELDRPLADYLLDPFLHDEPRIGDVTLRMALSHTSGINHSGQPQMLADPGRAFSYSTGGLCYMQRVMEEVTGMPFGRLMDERILGSLGMGDSSFVWDERYETQATRSHDRDGGPRDHDRPVEGNPGGTLLTHPADYCKFLCAILQPRESNNFLLGPNSVKQMLTSQTQLIGRMSWGLGWGLEHGDDGTWFWHWGGGMVRNLAVACKERRAGVVIMTNSIFGGSVWEPIVAAALGGDHPALERLRWVDPSQHEALKSVHLKFADALGATLSAVVKKRVDVDIPYMDVFPNLEHIQFLGGQHARHYSFGVEGAEGRALITLFGSTVLALLDAEDIEARPLDKAQEARFASVAEKIAADLADAWRAHGVEVVGHSPQRDLAGHILSAPDLVNAMVPFALSIEGVDGQALNRREGAFAGHALCVTYQASALASFTV